MTGQVAPHDLATEHAIIGRMLVRPDAIGEIAALVSAADFYRPEWGSVFTLLVDAWRTGEPWDGVALQSHAGGLVTPEEVARLLAGAPAGHRRMVERLLDLRVRRDLVRAGAEITAAGRDLSVDPIAARDVAASVIQAIETPLEPVRDLWRLDAFMDQPDDGEPWVIPGLFKAGWRAIVVATEGRGKSWLSRQIATAAASGVHPLMVSDRIEPITTLIVDLENPAGSIADAGRRMRSAAGDRWAPERAFLWHRPGGINLRTRQDRAKLEAVIAEARPRFVSIGPLYKAYTVSARESDEQAAAEVQSVLDDLRTRYGFALLLEHHAPKATGSVRDILPYGSSLWLRWPELGLKLVPWKDDRGEVHKTKLEVGRWRMDRVPAEWPQRIDRGVNWPWIGEWDQTFTSAPEEERFW